MNWLGAIGGVERVLLKIFGFAVGGYIQFHALISIINDQYAHDFDCGNHSKTKSTIFEGGDKEKINFNMVQQMMKQQLSKKVKHHEPLIFSTCKLVQVYFA